MKHLIVKGITGIAFVAALALPIASPAFAQQNTGQPGTSAGVNCEVSSNALMTPGRSSSAPGAPFNEPGINSLNGGTAGSVYAGSGANTKTPSSPNAVSQYDVACSHQP